MVRETYACEKCKHEFRDYGSAKRCEKRGNDLSRKLLTDLKYRLVSFDPHPQTTLFEGVYFFPRFEEIHYRFKKDFDLPHDVEVARQDSLYLKILHNGNLDFSVVDMGRLRERGRFFINEVDPNRRLTPYFNDSFYWFNLSRFVENLSKGKLRFVEQSDLEVLNDLFLVNLRNWRENLGKIYKSLYQYFSRREDNPRKIQKGLEITSTDGFVVGKGLSLFTRAGMPKSYEEYLEKS